ncbi:hypothetical protein J2I47_24330 [Fibrella sp. HMF5335]|uniref:Uncharacterized protein n=1 Tax=Fibrella rubiginis TaxID=2817060 RepID=A0A939K3X0_9BACT|nr:hypothetical protein [Fibrella rubiginis]MBO0939697.1 hypothetical protein [Fibrella rubiginis]
MRLSIYSTLVFPLLLLTACAAPKSLTAELTPRSLRANNLEETISRRDEVMLAYSLVSYDNHNKAIGVTNGGWGVESIKKGQSANLGQPIPVQLPMPRGGKIVASVVLVEVDDYKAASTLIGQIQKINNMVAVPAGILLTATEVLTPLKYVSAGLAAAGLGLQFANQLDDDDVLGQSSVTISEADWRKSRKSFMHVPARFTGQHLRDSFDYELTYDVALKTLKMGPSGQ